MRLVIAILLSLVLVGCGLTKPVLHIERVEVPIPVPCNIVPPKKPPYPFSDNIPDRAKGETIVYETEDPKKMLEELFTDVKRLLAETKAREGYELELETAIKACNSK